MTGQEVVQRTPTQELVARVRGDQFQQELALALPEGVRQERFVRAAATALLDQPDLADPSKVEPQSVFQSLLKSAQDGLVPDGREAALVIFGRKAQYLPMIGGFRKIAAESGWTIRSAVVHENDVFEVELGNDPNVRHVPVRPGADPGDPIAAYAIGAHGDGRREVEVMTVDEIEKVRAVSRSKDRGPWVDWWERMAEKTAGRRLFAKLPLGDRERVERVLAAAALEPADAAVQMYGPSGGDVFVDHETGEITSGADGITPTGQQAEAADVSAGDGSAATPASPPPAASVPDSDEEPSLEDEPEDPGQAVIPGGTHEGKTLAEIAAKGAKGEEWLGWASRHPESKFVGPELHAALQRFRPQLFSSDAS